jgi:glucoside 3-dehydrogenase (cytochrome c) hitch-hiker subunit
MDQRTVNRRDALRRLAAVGVGAASTPLWVETLCALAREQAPHAHIPTPTTSGIAWTPKVLSARQNEAITSLCELIIPETDTPGAKAAQVNRFVDGVLVEASPDERAAFLAGLAWMDARSKTLFGLDLLSATPVQQTALLARMSDDSRDAEDKAGTDFFRALKSMTITGYYTTPIGLQRELGDDGRLVLAEFTGCTHPQHQT